METTVLSELPSTDYRLIADAIRQEFTERKKRRSHLEKQWKEIDRQLRMEPELSHKMGINPQTGRMVKDPKRNWMPEIELPLQAGALETLLSDVRRMRYPSNRDWFTARAGLTQKFFAAFKESGSPFLGERGQGFSGTVKQDDADKMVQGLVSHFHDRYDFRGHMDLIDAQALTYCCGVGRLRRVKGRHLGFSAKQQDKEKESPVLVPRSIKNVLFDDSQHALMHEGYALGQATIQFRYMKLADLNAIASDDDDYIVEEVRRLKGDRKGNVLLVELEGDFTYDRGSETVILKDVELTMATDEKAAALVKKKEGEKFCTYIAHQYHLEGPEYAYATSPLLKGMPIAKAAAQALNRVIEAGLLKNFPPLQYSPDDPNFSADGGPDVFPKALWPTIEGVTPAEVGGDPEILFNIFQGLVQMYEDIATGVTPARRGAQTKSHTTAYAKSIEEQRGVVRTVDYVRSTLEAPMTRLLYLEYRMGLEMMRGPEDIYIQEWDEFVSLKKGHLPDVVKFMAIGADAPAEEQQRSAERIQSAATAMQIDAGAVQFGREPAIQDHRPLIEQILRDGGWHSIEELLGAGDADTEAKQLPGILASVPGLA